MKAFILSLVASSLCIALVSSLSPEGSLSKYVRFLASLLLIGVLIVPIKNMTETIRSLSNGELTIPGLDLPTPPDAEQDFNNLLDNTSKNYFLQSLTQLLEREFQINSGDIRCTAIWAEENGEVLPKRITVLLSGSAIWKDPKTIEKFIEDLLACECVTAIE